MTGFGRFLLALDAVGGLSNGAFVFAAQDWLAGLTGVAPEVLAAVATVNVAYGTYSAALNGLWAAGVRRGGPLRLLAAANMAWGGVCAVLLATVEAGALGQAQFALEGLFVGGLGAVEWRAWRRIP